MTRPGGTPTIGLHRPQHLALDILANHAIGMAQQFVPLRSKIRIIVGVQLSRERIDAPSDQVARDLSPRVVLTALAGWR